MLRRVIGNNSLRNGIHRMMGIKKGILENKKHLIPISTHYYIANLPICNEIKFASFHNLKNFVYHSQQSIALMYEQ
jgi:hypothetical protein